MPQGLPRHEVERLRRAASEPGSQPLTALVERRRAGEPLQYIEGAVDFGGLELAVDPRALIPRPETEYLWEMAVGHLGEAGPGTVIVDMGTGSGALALALKKSFPRARVHATDLSEEALALAAENAAATGLDIELHKGDLFAALPGRLKGRVDLLVANPPYVAAPEFAALPIDVRIHEPEAALVAGPEGDEVLARIGEEAFWWLGVGGWLFIEIGETQGDRAYELFAGLDREVRLDLTGRVRILAARKGAGCFVRLQPR